MSLQRGSIGKRVLISTLVLSGVMMTTTVSAMADNGAVVGNSATPSLAKSTNVSAESSSGQVGTMSYTYQKGVYTLNSGEIDRYIFPWPWRFDHNVTGFEITGKIKLKGKAPSQMFDNLSNLKSITGMKNNIDTSEAVSLQTMFNNDPSLVSLDLSSFRTYKATNVDSMFSGDDELAMLDLSHFDTTNALFPDNVFGNKSNQGVNKLYQMTISSRITAGFLSSLPDTGHQWVAVGSGTAKNPQGKTYTYTEFIQNPIFDPNQPMTSETFVWKRDLGLELKSELNGAKTIYQGQHWDPKEAILSASSTDPVNPKDTYSNIDNVIVTDQDGNPVTQQGIDSWVPGDYQLTYKNGGVSKQLTLTIKQDQSALDVTKNKQLYQNQSFTDADMRHEIQKATDSAGKALEPTKVHYQIKDAAGTPVAIDDLTKQLGQYTVTFATDTLLSGETKTATMTIDVAKDQTSLKLKQPSQTITAGQSWQPIDDFDSATDATGKPVDFKDITVTATDEKGNPVKDLSTLHKTPGVYKVTYKSGNVTRALTLTVKKATAPVTPGGNFPSLTPPASSSSSSSSSSAVTPSQPTLPSQPADPQLPNYAGVKGSAVYAIKKIGLYRNPDFIKANRKLWYVNKPRIYRPMFVVTGYARSITGKLRYQVTDVNHQSKTAGMTGYITASRKYVRPVYYAAKHSQVTVISPKGLHAYQREDLTGKVTTYRQGTVLKVKGITKHNLTTRYQLTNGKYVTANRKLVTMGRHAHVTKLRAKTNINRYATVNLTRKNRAIKKGIVLKVHHYDYSRGHDYANRGTLRYRVAGGYVTGNSKYVQVYY